MMKVNVGDTFTLICCSGTKYEFTSSTVHTVMELNDDGSFLANSAAEHRDNRHLFKWQKKRNGFVTRMGPFDDQHFDLAVFSAKSHER